MRRMLWLGGVTVIWSYLVTPPCAFADPTMEFLNHTRGFSVYVSLQVHPNLFCGLGCPPIVDSTTIYEHSYEPYDRDVSAGASWGFHSAFARGRQAGSFSETHLVATGGASASSSNYSPGGGCCTSSSSGSVDYSLSFALAEGAVAQFAGFVDTSLGTDVGGAGIVLSSEGREILRFHSPTSGGLQDPPPVNFSETLLLYPGYYLLQAGASGAPLLTGNSTDGRFSLDLTIRPIPEPATVVSVMLVLGFLFAWAIARRRPFAGRFFLVRPNYGANSSLVGDCK